MFLANWVDTWACGRQFLLLFMYLEVQDSAQHLLTVLSTMQSPQLQTKWTGEAKLSCISATTSLLAGSSVLYCWDNKLEISVHTCWHTVAPTTLPGWPSRLSWTILFLSQLHMEQLEWMEGGRTGGLDSKGHKDGLRSQHFCKFGW